MKKILLISAALLMSVGLYGKSNDPKTGVIDVEILVENYSGTDEVVEEINAEIAKVQAEIEVMEAEIVAMQTTLLLLPPAEQEAQQVLIDDKLEALAVYTTVQLEELTQFKTDLTTEMVEEIKLLVQEYADDNGYDFIFEKSNFYYYNSDEYDITQDIIDEMF